MLRRIYLSPLGRLISIALNLLSFLHKPFMVYGYSNAKNGRFFKHTRIGSNVTMGNRENIDIRDHVWIGFSCHVDGIGGVTIMDGVNVASHTCIYTHSSQNAIRLLGNKFIEVEAAQRPGYILGEVFIGEYTFIGTSCVLLPGTRLGKGCVVGAGSVVKGVFPDFSLVVGNPAQIVGSTLDADRKLYNEGVDFSNYFDPATLQGKIKSN